MLNSTRKKRWKTRRKVEDELEGNKSDIERLRKDSKTIKITGTECNQVRPGVILEDKEITHEIHGMGKSKVVQANPRVKI